MSSHAMYWEKGYAELLRAEDTGAGTILSPSIPQEFHTFPFEGQASTVFAISWEFTQEVSVAATDRTSTALKDAIAWRSLQIALVHEQMDVFSDPSAAGMLGMIMDSSNISFKALFDLLDGPEDLRALTRVARARFLRETLDGVAAEAVAFQVAERILESPEDENE